jgi:7,8-dihydropterin-6-yl-methyl-4-(beta-D-ribofuranosyl)aminobenzene 5'-phosphate synthase
MTGSATSSRTRLWAFAVGAVACMLVLCLAHQAPGLLGKTAPAATATPEDPVSPTASAMPEAVPEPVSTVPPDAELQPTQAAQPTVAEEPITLTIVYDNHPMDPRLQTGWGFACWIEVGRTTVLFDTGADGAILLGNLAALGYDPSEIDIVVLSHAHDDHTGGLQALLEVNDHLKVFVPSVFPESLKARARERATLFEVQGPLEITDGVWSLGPMGTSPVEQSLAIQTSQGLIVVTGCAHPGIATIVRAAREMDRIHLVLGGFHLLDKSTSEIEAAIAQLRDLGVEQIAPCHCTGDEAIRMFASAFGDGYVPVGAGTVLSVPR